MAARGGELGYRQLLRAPSTGWKTVHRTDSWDVCAGGWCKAACHWVLTRCEAHQPTAGLLPAGGNAASGAAAAAAASSASPLLPAALMDSGRSPEGTSLPLLRRTGRGGLDPADALRPDSIPGLPDSTKGSVSEGLGDSRRSGDKQSSELAPLREAATCEQEPGVPVSSVPLPPPEPPAMTPVRSGGMERTDLVGESLLADVSRPSILRRRDMTVAKVGR